MPGWILVANRFSFLTNFGKNGGLPRAVLSLACLVILTGCSNLRQQSLDSPLPILPSQAAVEADEVSPLVLPLGEADVVVADSSVEGGLVSGSSAFENDFDTGSAQTGTKSSGQSSIQKSLPVDNDFQPPQLQARFVGLLDKAEMSGVKLKAISSAAPAPAIGMEKGTAENCITPEVCKASTSAQCDCCKKKELPQLAAVEPIDPEQLPKLFGVERPLTKDNAELPLYQPMLQPLRSASAAVETNAPQETNTAPKADADSVIRLTALQGSGMSQDRLPSVAAPAQPQNRAQLLFPIPPDKLKEFQAESELATTRAAETLKAKSVIKVSPVMDINSAVAEASTGAVAVVTASEPADSPAGANKSQAKFIPVSSSGIRVSAIPFKSFSSAMSKPPRKAPIGVLAGVVAESSPPTVPKKVVEPTPPTKPVEFVELSQAKAALADSNSNSNSFAPPLNTSVKALPVVSEDFPVARTATNEFAAPLMPIRSEAKSEVLATTEFETSPSPNIDPLVDFDLPDMAQIEEELDRFKKDNTPNPTTVVQEERIDPAVLLAKLDGPPKKIAAPVAKVIDPAPDKNLLVQQLAAQSSTLEELRNDIDQLKPKPEELELTLNNPAFCTKISGFGQLEPFAANTFSGSQKTLLYCEVENQTSKRFTSFDGSDQFETVLHGAIVIYDANDRVVQTEKFPAIKDIARKQRRDFYVYFPLQFNELTSGDYRLELSVEDVAGNETAVLRPFMRFSVE